MLFCEKCNFITEGNCCPSCGNKKLREVHDEDFCFFVNLSAYHYQMLEFTLKEKGIEVVGLPFYVGGVSLANAGRAEARKVFIRYQDIEHATEIYNTLFGGVAVRF